MKLLSRSLMLLLVLFALVAVGCGSDDDDPETDTTTDTTTDMGGDTAGDTTTDTPGDTPSDTVEDTTTDTPGDTPGDTTGDTPGDMVAMGACTNAADGAIIAADPDAPANEAGTCGVSCLADMDPLCAQNCIVNATGLSEACSACYAGAVACATENCLAECVADPGAPACEMCRETAGCDAAAVMCTGLTPTP